MKKFLSLIFIFSITICIAQNNQKQSLYVVHVDAGGKGQFKQKIYSYHFLNGSFTGREETITVDGKKEGKDYIRTDRGSNLIYNNRYLITGIGNIIDLKDKRVLFDGKAGLVRCSNDSAIFYTNDVFKGKFYSVYDFKTQQYKEVKDLLFKPRAGRDVEFDKTVSPFKLLYYPQGKPKVVLTTDAGYGQQGTKETYTPDPPIYWIDNDNFIYVYFNKDNTEITINKVNVDSKTSTVIGKTMVTKETTAAVLTRVNAGQLILRIGNKLYFIDINAGAVTPMDYSRPDHGFSYECKADNKGRMVKLEGKDLGKHHFETRNFSAGDNIACFVKELIIGTDSYQQGLMSWNATKKTWESVDADEVLVLLGWTND
jgi:hypothetical protein